MQHPAGVREVTMDDDGKKKSKLEVIYDLSRIWLPLTPGNI